MASLESYRNKAFVDFCNQALEDFISETYGVQTTILATSDGFELASNIAHEGQAADKLSAVGSSLFALGGSLVGEFDLEACNAITIDSVKGKVYIREITDEKDRSLILMIRANNSAMLAHILHGANKLANKISKRMQLLA